MNKRKIIFIKKEYLAQPQKDNFLQLFFFFFNNNKILYPFIKKFFYILYKKIFVKKLQINQKYF